MTRSTHHGYQRPSERAPQLLAPFRRIRLTLTDRIPLHGEPAQEVLRRLLVCTKIQTGYTNVVNRPRVSWP